MNRRFESNRVTIHRKPEEIFGFLSDFNNFSHLMPEQVTNWNSDEDSCSFEIKGLASLAMRITEKVPFSKVVMSGEGKLPFDFSLVSNIEAQDGNSEVQLVMQAELSAFTAMVAEKPLASFINLLVDKLKRYMESAAV